MTWHQKNEEIQKSLRNCHEKRNSAKVLPFHITFGEGGSQNGYLDDVENRVSGPKIGTTIGVNFRECAVFLV
jgi:hypothetical protein